jgi:hypothetical protein
MQVLDLLSFVYFVEIECSDDYRHTVDDELHVIL